MDEGPIETAPRDGRPIMVWCTGEIGGTGPHWFSPVSITSDGRWWDDVNGVRIEPIYDATHWRLAPPPPGVTP